MSYNDIYAAIAARIALIEIADPEVIAAGSVKAYLDPVEQLQDTPCFVIFSPSIPDIERGAGSRSVMLDFMQQCFVQNEDKDRAHDIAKRLQEATVDIFDGDVVLGAVSPLIGQRLTAVTGLQYGGRQYIGFENHLITRSVEARNFTA